MSILVRQAILVSLTGVGLVGLSLFLSRRGLLSFRYGVGWLAVGLALIVGGLGLGWVDSISKSLGVTPTTLVLVGVAGGLLAICVQLSISLSGSREHIRDLTETVALLDARVQSLEMHEP
ncbi:MAG: DUF2304 domain-containing protein [Ilumatobacteraceae bacterium]|nr:DUF2304 domain-containing protein [Ilumatobacteraceae bacterium]